MKKFSKILLAISFFTFSGVASAMPITGVIKFGGDLTFDFATNTVDIIGDDALVVASPTGDFGSFVSLGDTATYNDFTYSPLAVNTGTLWEVGGFTFTLNEITSVVEFSFANFDFLMLSGGGTFSGNGFDDTNGVWTFSADGSSISNEFTFSSTNIPETFSSTNIPEPGIALLLGIGLIGFGISRKLRKTS